MGFGPKTLEEAKGFRYGTWAGNRKGTVYDPNRCAEEVAFGGRMVIFHQCYRKNGHGPKGLYCKQHAKKNNNPVEPTAGINNPR